MVGRLQPLDEKFPVVGPDGRPTLYFTRWAQQRMQDIGIAITAEQAEAIANEVIDSYALVAGTGITITPDGKLSSNPTIAADVQALLDSISTTQGAILYRGASDWQALAPGSAGEVLTTGGAGADPAWAAGGGGSDFILPTSGTLPLTVGSPGIVNFNSRALYVGDLINLDGITGRGVTVSGDVEVIAYIEGITDVNFNSVGLFLSNGTRYLWLAALQAGGFIRAFEQWDTRSIFSGGVGSRGFGGGAIANWFRMTYNSGTGVTTGFASYDGLNWFQIASTSTWLSGGVTSAGVGCARNNTGLSPHAYIRSFQVV